MAITKPWYLSRTILASFVTVAAAAAGLGGIVPADAEASALADSLLQALSGISGLVAILGRMRATAKIG